MPDPKRTSAVLGCGVSYLSMVVGTVLLLVGIFAFSGQTRLILVAVSLAIVLLGRLASRIFFRRFLKCQSAAQEHFWQWFVANETEFRSLSPNDFAGQGEAIQKICEELKKVSGFTAEMCIRAEAKAELVVSADGQARYFCLVDEFVDKAPPLEHWQLTRLKPRKGVERMILGGTEFTTESIYYLLGEPQEDGRLPITFYFTGYREDDPALRNHFGQAAFIFLDGLLGERDTGEGIGALSFQPMEARPEASRQLTDLARHFDEVKPKPASS